VIHEHYDESLDPFDAHVREKKANKARREVAREKRMREFWR
jgi:hypothetical protein